MSDPLHYFMRRFVGSSSRTRALELSAFEQLSSVPHEIVGGEPEGDHLLGEEDPYVPWESI